MKNQIEFKVSGKFALFTDPVIKIGGEKCSYHIPTYEALKGIVKSVYWKPTLVWYIDRVRIMKQIRSQAKSVKPLKHGGGNELSIYTYLLDVEYQVQAHLDELGCGLIFHGFDYPDKIGVHELFTFYVRIDI